MHLASVLASIALFVPVPNAHIAVQGCPANREVSCTIGDAIYLRPGDLRAGYPDAHLMLAHELGHVWDNENMTAEDRDHYKAVIGFERAGWYEDPTASGSFSLEIAPAEYFADAYALCSMSPRYRRWLRTHDGAYFGGYGETITRRDLAITCWLIHNHYSGSTRKRGV